MFLAGSSLMALLDVQDHRKGILSSRVCGRLSSKDLLDNDLPSLKDRLDSRAWALALLVSVLKDPEVRKGDLVLDNRSTRVQHRGNDRSRRWHLLVSKPSVRRVDRHRLPVRDRWLRLISSNEAPRRFHLGNSSLSSLDVHPGLSSSNHSGKVGRQDMGSSNDRRSSTCRTERGRVLKATCRG